MNDDFISSSMATGVPLMRRRRRMGAIPPWRLSSTFWGMVGALNHVMEGRCGM